MLYRIHKYKICGALTLMHQLSVLQRNVDNYITDLFAMISSLIR